MPKHNPIFIPRWVARLSANCPKPCESFYCKLPLLMHWRTVGYLTEELVKHITNPHVSEHIQQSISYCMKMIADVDSNPLVARLSVSKHVHNEVVLTITTDVAQPDACAFLFLRVNDEGVITQLVRNDMNLDANSRI